MIINNFNSPYNFSKIKYNTPVKKLGKLISLVNKNLIIETPYLDVYENTYKYDKNNNNNYFKIKFKLSNERNNVNFFSFITDLYNNVLNK